jgi:hypothetical protein
MPKPKAPAVPNTHTLRVLMEEYREMLRDAERGVGKVLALDPQNKDFWDAISDLHPTLTLVESRSKGIVEEIEGLIDQLPDDQSE